MGRRKIEIKAIKDDRNRSVTFLKRKGGLFKKAHELSVLCSVDVAVIIFGNNKKLYEYSSSDIGEILTRYQYYGGANEHKGPADFTGKGKDMDSDDDDASVISGEPQMMPPHQYQNQAFQHIRHQTPSNSPPIPNGVFPHPQRQHTPQPQSRPSSRNTNMPRRQSSLVPQQHVQPQNGYAFMPNPAIYNPHQPAMPSHPNGLPQHMQAPPMQGPPQGVPQAAPQYPNYGPPQQQPHHQQVQQMYEEQRRASMPPTFPSQERPPSRPESTPPQPQQQQTPQMHVQTPQMHVQTPQQQTPQQQSPPQQEQEEPQPPQQLLNPVKRMSVKSRSIFTPIDESRSILSQHWASSTSNGEPKRSDTATSNNRSQSIDVGAVSRVKASNSPPTPQRAQTQKNRNISMSSMPEGFHPPSRTNSASVNSKRPTLKVQIPEETSDGGSENNSPRSGVPPNRQNGHHEPNASVVLPPPSPSASALLSAGASGPPNPFARPHHPVSQPSQGSNNSNMIDTPVSALPSRFMTNEFLPSPSSFYPDWNFSNDRNSNTLPSPLNFATPVVGTGPSFLREDSGERMNGNSVGKRKTPEMEGGGSGEENGGGKRMKHDG